MASIIHFVNHSMKQMYSFKTDRKSCSLISCMWTSTRALVWLETDSPLPPVASPSQPQLADHIHQGSYMSIALIGRQPLCCLNISSTSRGARWGWGCLPESCVAQVGRSFGTAPEELMERLSLLAEATLTDQTWGGGGTTWTDHSGTTRPHHQHWFLKA